MSQVRSNILAYVNFVESFSPCLAQTSYHARLHAALVEITTMPTGHIESMSGIIILWRLNALLITTKLNTRLKTAMER